MIPVFLIVSSVFALVLFYLLLVSINLQYAYSLTNRTGILNISFFPFKLKNQLHPKKKPEPETSKDISLKKKTSDHKRQFDWRILIDEFEILKLLLVRALELLPRLARFPDRYYLNISLKGGFDAPDVTGYIYGGVNALKPQLAKIGIIEFKPDFNANQIVGTIGAGVELRIVILVKELLIFIWKLPKLKTINFIRKLRKGNKSVK